MGRNLVRALLPCAIAIVGGCGSGSGDRTTDPPAPKLVAVALSPDAATVPVGLSQPFIATARYDDGSTADVTGLTRWSSSDEKVASVDDGSSKGLARGLVEGSARISAALDGVEGSAGLTVAPAALQSIEVVSLTGSVAMHDVRPFRSTGTYSDGTAVDLTEHATWTVSDSGIAEVSDAAGSKGVAFGVAAGTVSVTAAVGAVTGSAPLTVLPITGLDVWVPAVQATTLGDVGVDAGGNVLAVWSRQFTGAPWGTAPVVLAARRSPGSDWSVTSLDFGAITDPPRTPALAVNADGHALAAWSGRGGVYAARYAPGVGWTPVETLASGTSLYLSYGESVRAAIDTAGNGMVVWGDDTGGAVRYARFDPGSGTWAPAAEIAGVNRGMANAAMSLDMNASGEAVLLWERWGSGALPWSVRTVRFVPGTGAGSGWSAPATLNESDSYVLPSVAINGSGTVVAVWPTDYGFPGTLQAMRYRPGTGWQPPETVTTDAALAPIDPRVALNDTEEIVVAWRSGLDDTVRASRSSGGGAWDAPAILWQPVSLLYHATPELLRPYVASNGRMVVGWHAEDLYEPHVTGLRRFSPAQGWAATTWLESVPHVGTFGDPGALAEVRWAFNAAGAGAVLWLETPEVFDGQVYWNYNGVYADVGVTY